MALFPTDLIAPQVTGVRALVPIEAGLVVTADLLADLVTDRPARRRVFAARVAATRVATAGVAATRVAAARVATAPVAAAGVAAAGVDGARFFVLRACRQSAARRIRVRRQRDNHQEQARDRTEGEPPRPSAPLQLMHVEHTSPLRLHRLRWRLVCRRRTTVRPSLPEGPHAA